MNQIPIGRRLAALCLQGLITLEDLDSPTQSWLAIEDDRRKANRRAVAQKIPQPYPLPPDYINLARSWISSNKAEWESMLMNSLNSEQPDPPPPNPLHGLL